MKKPYIIGIAGGSGSGKSTFAAHLKDSFAGDVVLIHCDNYYQPHDDISLEERALLNYDAPESIDFDLMARQLESLKNNEAIDSPLYDFAAHTRSDEVLHLEPAPVIIVDGILLFAVDELNDLMDLKIFVEADADERILRRTRRDVIERGRSLESVMDQYLNTVKPMHNKYVEPSKVNADLIVNGGRNPKAIAVVRNWIARQVFEFSKEDE
ncbi:MAG: uridine kinase [Erysipelotrichaceae bacterium]|nr:uridine kinase [Erysipelotrichaceae bacterium]